ncbi:iron-containing alcohol dehydrogenase [Youngiibacter fragilis]|uniref:Alcohol dehydrogenase n=1 Tax=Youngiibacter fragilis 232.1 TaxID=994573 RepID=V7HZW9_9CLOT|nr:iron-containing alcohol dehydrogenase [Youngiibacter fragilis]ETA79530.1 alcohol dehydrogenase [Youngiibacter fragilis 232.1]
MFRYHQPTIIHFGKGELERLAEVASRYGSSCLLVTTPNEAPLDKLFDRVRSILNNGGIRAIQYDGVMPNPTVAIVEEGLSLAMAEKVDFILAVGGGSSIDTAKVIALNYGVEKIDWDKMFSEFTNPFMTYGKVSQSALPLLAVPTTSGTGSQVTQAAVISRGTDKNTIFHQDNFPVECIIDPELMATLPPRITASTGFDAFTHAFESLINKRSSLFTELQGMKAMELVIEYLPKALEDGKDISYREMLSMADTLAGSSLANAGAAAPHPLGEIIGGVTHISHGETLAVVFPAYVKNAWKDNVAKFAKVSRLFNRSYLVESDEVAAEALHDEIVTFLKVIGLNRSLSDLGVKLEEFNAILESPVLGFLPFGGKDELQEILRQSY